MANLATTQLLRWYGILLTAASAKHTQLAQKTNTSLVTICVSNVLGPAIVHSETFLFASGR